MMPEIWTRLWPPWEGSLEARPPRHGVGFWFNSIGLPKQFSEFEGLTSPTWRGVVGLSLAHWRAGDLPTAYATVENRSDPQSQILKATYLVQSAEVEAGPVRSSNR